MGLNGLGSADTNLLLPGDILLYASIENGSFSKNNY